MKKIQMILVVLAAMMVLTACEKVSPIGVLVSGTGVEDRVKMSHLYFQQHKGEGHFFDISGKDEYSFIIGADSHMTTDDGRMREMLQNGLDHDDLLYAHLGDMADTKPEYYINLENVISEYKWKFARKYFEELFLGNDESVEEKDNPDFYMYMDSLTGMVYSVDDVPMPFFPVVGNHDITHNGWAQWSNIFHSSFYEVLVQIKSEPLTLDRFIFLDTANGTLGEEQVNLIEEDGYALREYLETNIRNTFVFSHTNIFRPSSLQFASTFAREETFFLLNQFHKWDATIVFCGHVHKWDEQVVDNVRYITLDSMSERNSPNPGDYLLRVHVKANGELTWERVRMNYTKK
ncbi:MAG: metallophosphoesterase [Bacteroidaceae bacterium]|nr:metallophosphoesterase [Bacteroidaceae bacterium]